MSVGQIQLLDGKIKREGKNKKTNNERRDGPPPNIRKSISFWSSKTKKRQNT